MAEFKPGMETPKPQVPRMPENRVRPTEGPKSERVKRVEGRLEHMVKSVQDYFADMKTAYDAAAWELGGQTVFGRVMEGATVVGTGAVLEVATQKAAGKILSGIADYFINPNQAGGGEVFRGRVGRSTPESRPMDKGERGPMSQVSREAFLTKDFQEVELPQEQDLREYVKQWATDKWQGDGVFARFMRNGVIEGFDDATTMALYSFVNRILGEPLPYVPAKNLGLSIAGDFIGGALGSTEEQKAFVGRKLGEGKVGKTGKFVLDALNLANPVSIFGATLVKNGVDAYRQAFKDVRAAREAVQQGGRNVMYVAEGRPNYQKPWQRNRPWQRGGGRHG